MINKYLIEIMLPNKRKQELTNVLFCRNDDCECENNGRGIMVIELINKIIINSRMEPFEDRSQVIEQHPTATTGQFLNSFPIEKFLKH